MKSFKSLALAVTAATLIAMPTVAPAQQSMGSSPLPGAVPGKTVTVSGAIARVSAGVIILVGGRAIYVNNDTKVIGSMPTVNSVITVTGTPGDRGSVTALTVQIKK